MIRRGFLTAALVALVAAPAQAEAGRTVALVLDRSASLRHADPTGRGPRLLAQALALALQPGDRLAILPTHGDIIEPGAVARDPASLRPMLASLLAATPRPGGADLRGALARALQATGARGLVVVYSDDDLDVVGANSRVPAEVMTRAKGKSARPTRDDVNRAARAMLREAIEGAPASPAIVALRAPLPARARATPFLEDIGARVVDLVQDDLEVASSLAALIRGDPIVSRLVELKAGTTSLDLPYPARVAIVTSRPCTVEGAVSLDGEGGRLWLIDTPGRLGLPEDAGAIKCLVAPRLGLEGELLGYRLLGDAVRVVAPDLQLGPGQRLIVRQPGASEGETALEGSPLTATLPVSGQVERVEVLLVLEEEGRRAVAARRDVSVAPGTVEVVAEGEARVGKILTLRGTIPRGLEVSTLPLEVREGSGSVQRVTLERKGDGLQGRLTCQAPGALTLASLGDLGVRLPKPITVQEAPRYGVTIVSLQSAGVGGRDLNASTPLKIRGKDARIKLVLTLEPKPPEPIQVQVTLVGAPEGARLEPTGPWAFQDRHEVEMVLTWPDGAESAEVGLKCEGVQGTAVPSTRTFRVEPPPPPWRLALAGGLILVALVWIVTIFRRRRARARAEGGLQADLANRQLRTLGPDGRISPERYLFRDHYDRELEHVLIKPEESPGGDLIFALREDGNVKCEARDGAKIIHQDRPTVLANSSILGHGIAFAMVHGHRALRYVYLEDEPDADELTTRWLADAQSYEAELRDSGVYLILDEDQNITKYSARLDASSTEIFPPGSESTFETESSDEVSVVPNVSGRVPLKSDEGIVIMNSDEGEILDSAEVDMIDSCADTDVGDLEDA